MVTSCFMLMVQCLLRGSRASDCCAQLRTSNEKLQPAGAARVAHPTHKATARQMQAFRQPSSVQEYSRDGPASFDEVSMVWDAWQP